MSQEQKQKKGRRSPPSKRPFRSIFTFGSGSEVGELIRLGPMLLPLTAEVGSRVRNIEWISSGRACCLFHSRSGLVVKDWDITWPNQESKTLFQSLQFIGNNQEIWNEIALNKQKNGSLPSWQRWWCSRALEETEIRWISLRWKQWRGNSDCDGGIGVEWCTITP